MEPNVVSFGESNLKEQDCEAFNLHNWLTSNCVSFYIEYIRAQLKTDHVFIFDPFTTQWFLQETDEESIAESIHTFSLQKYPLWCIPVNDSKDVSHPGTVINQELAHIGLCLLM